MGPVPAVAAVRLSVRRALVDTPAGSLVLVACSGGADSLALAAATAFEAPKLGLRAGAMTVDHQLQDGSGERAEAVAKALAGLGLDPVEVLTVVVAGAGGPEAAARSARYAALAEAADRLDAAAVLLGHTLDDQAETVLLGLARGSGTRSLSGMAPITGRYLRPLLDVDRSTTREAALAERLDVWDDPHNADLSFTRVRVREQALPMVEAVLGPGVPAALARTARLLRDDADALDEWAGRADEEASHPDGGCEVAVLASLPAAVRRRVLRQRALVAGVPAGSLAAVHLDAAEALVIAWHGQGPLDLPGGRTLRRRCGRLYFSEPGDRPLPPGPERPARQETS